MATAGAGPEQSQQQRTPTWVAGTQPSPAASQGTSAGSWNQQQSQTETQALQYGTQAIPKQHVNHSARGVRTDHPSCPHSPLPETRVASGWRKEGGSKKKGKVRGVQAVSLHPSLSPHWAHRRQRLCLPLGAAPGSTLGRAKDWKLDGVSLIHWE